ncbi:MAG: VWA domain-containing protein, partial [Dehalococcoidia bacterium]|nr:VWA domain-containing protein [Dehalococcoidia bacterium]
LEKQMTRAQQGGEVDDIDAREVQDLLGDEAQQTLEQLKRLADMLEEAGYLRMNGDKMELTPRGIRKIGQKALQDIFAKIQKDQFGKHETDWKGTGGERSDETKQYQFGDPFDLHLERTLMNALRRDASGPPLKISPDDFEVYETKHFAQSAIVLMLDVSFSMGQSGSFFAAKKVAVALDNLIRSQFPKDALYIVAFSLYAKELKRDALTYANVDEYAYGTNMQQAFQIARQLLSNHKAGNKQIIMVTDGEPTAHCEGGRAYFQYPPSPRTIDQTLREVKRCTKQGIMINTFMLDSNYYMIEFIDMVTKINRGRVFYTTPDKLGEYILVDYMSSKKKHIA